eukprot:scaffold901_cov167-Amphora_coffeaeformis.AAC.32
MASTARRAVRFFGTVHARVDAVRKEGADIMTPERFPAFLAATCVTGVIVGWQAMDRIQSTAEQEHLEKFERDNGHPLNDYRRTHSVQRRYTIASVKPVTDPRAHSLWTSSVE